MANLVIKNPPEFTEEICAVTEADKITAELENRIKAALINNDVFLKEALGVLLEAVNRHIESDTIHVTEQDKEFWDAKAETAEATQSESGLMGAGDKQKLDGVAENAEVNQDAFSKVKVGNVTIVANGKTSTFALEAGDNITITADNATKKITIAADKNGGNANTLGGHQASHFASADHAHDGRYYTETEVNSLLAGKAASSHSHAYLPLSGGTMTGDLNFPATKTIKLSGKFLIAGGLNARNDVMVLYPKGWSTNDDLFCAFMIGNTYTYINENEVMWAVTSQYNDKYYLGTPSARFKAVYANTGTIQTSDREKKKNIQEFNEDFIEGFIMGLIPVSYTLKQNESGRIHYGLIAQDVEDLMDKLEMDSKDFAGFIKSPKYETTAEEIEVENEVISEDGKKKIVKEKRYDTKRVLVENEYEYALRYEEFIAPIIKMLQILNNKLNSQQEEIGKLQTEIEELKVK